MNNLKIGDTALITCDAWFYAPDGRAYRAVYGTVRAILGDQETLGIKTNARSTNWYLEVGDTTIAGCQIHYAIRCNTPPPECVSDEREHEGTVRKYSRMSHVYNADCPK